MPLYNFVCSACGANVKKLLKPVEANTPQKCICGNSLTRNPQPASAQAVETLDNGIMSKRVVRIADAERIFAEYADNDPRLKYPV